MLTFNVCSKILTLCRDVDVDTGNRYRTHSLHLHFVTVASIIFENSNTDVDTKCEWAFKPCFISSEKQNKKRKRFYLKKVMKTIFHAKSLWPGLNDKPLVIK